MCTRLKTIGMIAYAEYYTDARIKGYVDVLTKNGHKVVLYCLKDEYSYINKFKNENLVIKFIKKKYQGDSKLLYILNYLFFFLLTFLKVSVGFFTRKIKVFHIHNLPDFIVFCAIVPFLFGKKIILDMHDIMPAMVMSKFQSDENSIIFKITKLQAKISLKFSNALIMADHSQADWLKNNNISHKNTNVFLNLPPLSCFHERPLHSYDEELKLVYHGTVTQRLGLDIAVKAVENLRENINISFTIIGNGDYKEELKEYCKTKKILNKSIYFKDAIPVESLQNELEKYDLGIVSNRKSILSDNCMLPVKLLEYVYMGIPVLVPRLKVIERYFNDEMVYYYEPENIYELVILLNKIYSRKLVLNDKIEKSKKFFNTYNWEKQSKEYLNLIKSLSA